MEKLHRPPIKTLLPEVIDQIAAGEVVERPAHMVKELVENSIDAGATEIEIEFGLGGKSFSISDNGCGISQQELALALSRHATSKITQVNDIFNLDSYGFRGEALASISSVSQLNLKSRVENSKSAFEVSSLFGKVSEVTPCGGSQGTSIEIQDLFGNVPARLKFLKSDSAESSQIKNVLKAMALAYPRVSFRVRSQGKLLFYWPSTEELSERVIQLLDVDKMYTGSWNYEGFQAEVVVSAPNKTMGTSKNIWIFVQNRWVQDRSLQAAVMEGYRSLLMHGEFPFAVVKLTSPKDQVDVNIHPAKSQVKFVDAQRAFRAVNRACRSVLEKAPWIEDMITDSGLGSSSVPQSYAVRPSSLMTDSEDSLQFNEPSFEKIQFAKRELQVEASVSNYETRPNYYKNDSQSLENERLLDFEVPTSTKDVISTNSGFWSQIEVLSQLNLTYILCQTAKSLLLVDQHAAHERVAYEKLMAYWKKGQIDIQSYLIPLALDFDESYVDVLEKNTDEISRLGIQLERLGPESMGVLSAPSLLKQSSIARALEKVANEMIEKGDSFLMENIISDICATMACHSVVRAGQPLSREQMQELLLQMDEFPMSSFCPHGRPVYVEYSYSKIEKDFGRIV